MLTKLLNSPSRPWQAHYEYLAVSTSLEGQLQKEAKALLKTKRVGVSSNEFVPNAGEEIEDELILLKLKGYIDQKDVSGKATELRKLPKAVQVGTLIEGEPFRANKIKRKASSLVDYYLDLDRKTAFTKRKFSQMQRLTQRKRLLKKKILKKKFISKNKNKI